MFRERCPHRTSSFLNCQVRRVKENAIYFHNHSIKEHFNTSKGRSLPQNKGQSLKLNKPSLIQNLLHSLSFFPLSLSQTNENSIIDLYQFENEHLEVTTKKKSLEGKEALNSRKERTSIYCSKSLSPPQNAPNRRSELTAPA